MGATFGAALRQVAAGPQLIMEYAKDLLAYLAGVVPSKRALNYAYRAGFD